MTFVSTVTVERVSFFYNDSRDDQSGLSHFNLYHSPKCSVHSQRSVLLSSRMVKVATIGTEGELERSSLRPEQPLVAIYVSSAVSAIQTHYEVLALCTERT